MKKTVKWTFILFGFLLVILLTSIAFLLLSQRGSSWVTYQAVEHFLTPSEHVVGDVQGNLWEGITLENLELQNIEGLPAGAVIRIQQLSAHVTSLGLSGVDARVTNARLLVPGADPVIIQGTLSGGILDANVFTPSLDVNHVAGLFDLPVTSEVTVHLKDIDLYISGGMNEPIVKGDLTIERLIYNDIRLSQAPLKLNLRFPKERGEYRPHGDVLVRGGTAKAKKVQFELLASRLGFAGYLENPELNIRAQTVIQKVEISVVVTGSKENPEIRLTSQPPLSEDKLLVMILTGASWQSIETAYSQQTLTPDLARELLDYYLLGGRGKGVASKLGIKDVRVLYDEETRGVGLTKEVTDRIDLQYEIKERHEGTQTSREQTIGGEIKVNKNVSFSLDRALKSAEDPSGEDSLEEPRVDDTIMLKFNKEF